MIILLKYARQVTLVMVRSLCFVLITRPYLGFTEEIFLLGDSSNAKLYVSPGAFVFCRTSILSQFFCSDSEFKTTDPSITFALTFILHCRMTSVLEPASAVDAIYTSFLTTHSPPTHSEFIEVLVTQHFPHQTSNVKRGLLFQIIKI